MCPEERFQAGPKLRISAARLVHEELALGVGPRFKGGCEEFFFPLPALVHGCGRPIIQAFTVPMRNLRTKTLTEMKNIHPGFPIRI